MPAKVFQAARHAGFVQIGRRGAQQTSARGQARGDQAGILQSAKADGQIEPAADQIQHLVGQLDIHAQLGVVEHEGGDQRNDEALAIGHRAGHAQMAMQLLLVGIDRGDGFVALLNQFSAALKEMMARIGHADLARGAVEKPQIQARFQPRDVPADLRCGASKLLGGAGETPRLRHRYELINARPK